MSSRRSRRSSRPSTGQTTTPVLSAEYLNKHSSKNDLVKRMRHVVRDLCDEAVEPDSPDYPGLAGLAAVLVEDRYLKHKDKEVRLHTVLACVEIFYMYAPEPPWDETEILKVFPQIIQQLANLATCTSPSQPNFEQYFSLLEKLSTVKIGVVLVEMTKTLESEHASHGDDDDDEEMTDAHKTFRKRNPNSGPTSEEALEILRELIEVLFHCVHIDHSTEITLHASSAISACVEEFDGGVPIPILDEILKCIGAGPVVHVTNPEFVKVSAKVAAIKRKKGKSKQGDKELKLPARYISQTNPAYVIAEKVIRKTVDRISTPIANLLNGLLNGDPHVIKHSDISCDIPMETVKGKGSVVESMDAETTDSDDVWTVVYELHNVSPQILTTVIGTVAADLKHVDEEKRLKVTRLLGRLFHSKTSDIGVNFHRCYREWTRRTLDRSVKVRDVMVRHLLEVLRNKASSTNLCEEATAALSTMVKQDPSLDIRLSCIHGICELVHNGKNANSSSSDSSSSSTPFISANLLEAVGDRVKSKIKKERLDSITGLAKIYNRHYMLPKVKTVEKGGDDCEIGVILDAIHESCDMSIYDENSGSNQRHSQGRGKRKQAASAHTSNSIDDMYTFIPRLVFESVCFKDTSDPVLRNRVWTLVDDILLGTESHAKGSDGKKTLKRTMSPTSRAVGLTMIINYLQSLSEDNGVTGKKSGVYQWMENLMLSRVKLQVTLRSYLDAKAKADSYPSGSDERAEANSTAFQMLEAVAKLTTPPSACSSPGSTDDLESILQKLHSARDKHIFRLLSSISSPSHSSTARIRALDDLPKRTKSLGSSTSAWIRTLARRSAMGYFMNAEIIEHCILLAQETFHEGDFAVCRSFLESAKTALNIFPSMSEKGFDYLVELFSECQASQPTEDRKQINQYAITTTLSGMLARTASTRGSPSKEKSDKSSTESSVVGDDVQSQLISLCTKDGTVEQARNAVRTLASLHENDPDKIVEVFQPLLETMTSSTRLSVDTSGKANKKVVNVLETLTAMVECVPSLFSSVDNSKKKRGAKAIRFALETVLLGRRDILSTQSNDDLDFPSDDEVHDRKSSGRPSSSKKKSGRKASDSGEASLSLACKRIRAAISFLIAHIRAMKSAGLSPSKEHISAVFGVLRGILEDGGKPPSSYDRQECQSYEDEVALRQCATVSIMRLCDGNLQLEKDFFTHSMWHILGKSFVDVDASVRESAMSELSLMLTGDGIYNRTIPSLRFLAYIALCPDCDVNSNNASNGHRGKSTKEAALKCTSTLRRTCETTLLRCRATSRNAEKNFEKRLKLMLMPEYAVPFAFHLLAFQLDTPSCGLNRKSGESAESYKILRKRLTWLFDPLVKSLGESADNISFLLRQSELLGQRYAPVDFDASDNENLADDASLGSTKSSHNSVLHSRLTVICSTAREVLLKFVKKDINLTPYPGGIQFPVSLFKATKSGTPNRTSDISIDEKELLQSSRTNTTLDSGKKSVRFDDALSKGSERDLDALQLSPIPLSLSPASRSTLNSPESRDKTKSPDSIETPASNGSTPSKKRRSPESRDETKSPDSIETPASNGSTPSKKRRHQAQSALTFSEEKKTRRSPRLRK